MTAARSKTSPDQRGPVNVLVRYDGSMAKQTVDLAGRLVPTLTLG